MEDGKGVKARARSRFFFLVLFLAVCLTESLWGATHDILRAPGASTALALDASDAVPGEILVKFREPVRAAAYAPVHLALGHQQLGRIDELGIARVGVPNIGEAIAVYERLPGVEFAEPNYIVRTDLTPNDPLFATRQQWYYDLIEAPAAWDVALGSPTVTVAVLDTGVGIEHPDLAAAIWTNPDETEGNRRDDDDNGCVDDVHGCSFAVSTSPSCRYRATPNNDIDDDTGHGTFAAGVIAGQGDNRLGITGVAPGVKIMPVKVLDCTGAGSTSAAAAGVLYAARMGADVINISFGGESESLTMKDALTEAHDTYGVVIVASAGNTATSRTTFPARLDNVIAVSASDRRNPDTKAPFSNWGPEVDVTAPGVDIVSTIPSQLCGEIFACLSSQPYASASGTSFSAALVSGTAALIISKNPHLLPDQVAGQLTRTAQDLPDGIYANWDGAGRVQAAKALTPITYRVNVGGITRN
ncbi:MAG: S8 family serine peptidase [Dehalococcoidia bacterium]|nr:S8 family serine peptidase [Dehalococcoidia bacterium]